MERISAIDNPNLICEKTFKHYAPRNARFHTRFKTGTFPFWQSGVVGDTAPLPPNAHSVETVMQGDLLKDEVDGYYVHDHRGSYIIDGMPAAWMPKVLPHQRR